MKKKEGVSDAYSKVNARREFSEAERLQLVVDREEGSAMGRRG